MGKFLLGALVGLALGAGATYVKLEGFPGRQGEPVTVDASATDADPAPDRKKGKKKRRPRRGGQAGGGDEPYEEIELSAADRSSITVGDALEPRDRQIDMGAGGGDVRNLEQGEIDGAIRQRADDIIGCITDARGDAPLAGRVVVGLVVGPDGRVTQSRIEAPRYLIEQGLAGCLRPVLRQLDFPAAGKDTVVKVPFDVS